MTGAAVSLFGRPVQASDPVTADVEDWQFVLGHGPAIEAFETRSVVEIADRCAAPSAWREWTNRLVPAGLGSAFSFPLSFGEACVGALTFYDAAPRSLSPQQRADAEFCGHLAAATAGAAAATGEDELLADVASRFDCATGVVIATLHVSAEEAESRIRTSSWRSGRPLRDVVDALITQDVASADLWWPALTAATDRVRRT